MAQGNVQRKPQAKEGRAWTSSRSASSSPNSVSSSSGSTTASLARTPAPTCRCTSRGQLSDLPEKSVEPIALNAGVPVADPPGVPQPARLGRRPGARPAPAHRPRRARRPQRHRRLRRDQRRQEGGQDPRRAAAVVRRRRQDRELHRHGPPGLRPRRLPLPARRRAVPARELGRRPRPLPRGRHPRRHGLPAQVEDRPGAVRPRRRPTACTSTGRPSTRATAASPSSCGSCRPAARSSSARCRGTSWAGSTPPRVVTRPYPQEPPRPRPQGPPPGQRQPAGPAGRRDARRPAAARPALAAVPGQGRAQGADGLGGEAPAVLPRGRRRPAGRAAAPDRRPRRPEPRRVEVLREQRAARGRRSRRCCSWPSRAGGWSGASRTRRARSGWTSTRAGGTGG